MRAGMYVIVSADTDSHSPFADELYHNEGGLYDVGEDELAELLEPLRPHVPCPVCSPRGRTTAVLAMREGRHGRFAGCTSFAAGPDHHCGHRERVCERCRQGLMIRMGNERARCQNPQCRHEAPLCRCTVARPMVVRRHGRTGQRFRDQTLGVAQVRSNRRRACERRRVSWSPGRGVGSCIGRAASHQRSRIPG